MIVPMKPKTNPEYDRFSAALGRVLKVSHSDMQAMLEAEKAEKRRKTKRVSSVRAKGASPSED